MKQYIKFLHALRICVLLLVLLGSVAQIAPAQEKVTSPEEFFGFQLGADRKIARWDKIIHYFEILERESGKIKVIDMGPSTMGHPFLLVIISSEENLSNLDRLQQVNATLSDPRGVAEAEIKRINAELDALRELTRKLTQIMDTERIGAERAKRV